MTSVEVSTDATKAETQQQVQANPSGIPAAPFITDVEEHLGGPEEEVEPTLRKFQDMVSKYKFMELNTAQKRAGLEDKIPDIRKTLTMVQHLAERSEASEPLETTFELSDTLYAHAKIEPVEEVLLWLGANVMLSYPLPAALALLTDKLRAAERSLESASSDLDFLRDQITTMEVNTARVHNWDVKRRRLRRLKEQGGKGAGSE